MRPELESRRTRRMRFGITFAVFAVTVTAALFTTPLERRLFNGQVWFAIVSGLYLTSAIMFLTAWNVDRKAAAPLLLAILVTLLLIGLSFVFVAIMALSGLR